MKVTGSPCSQGVTSSSNALKELKGIAKDFSLVQLLTYAAHHLREEMKTVDVLQYVGLAVCD